MPKTIDVSVFRNCKSYWPSDEAKDRIPRTLPDGSIAVVYQSDVYPIYRSQDIEGPFRLNMDDGPEKKSACPKAINFDEIDIVLINNPVGNESSKLLVDSDWHSSRIEEIISKSINPNAPGRCPICHVTGRVRYSLRHYFYHLLSSTREDYEEVVKKHIKSLDEFESREKDHLGEVAGIPIKRITKENAINDLKNEWRGALPGAKTPGSNLRKIDKNKRRP